MLHRPGADPWARRQPLAGDASNRRYTRTWDDEERSFILVEYPAETRPDLARDLQVADWLRGLGVRVPAVLATDLAAGWMVIEDLGTDDAEAVLRQTPESNRLELALGALGPLKVLAAQPISSLVSWNPPLDRWRMRWELAGFELWFVNDYRRAVPSAELDRWLDRLAETVARHPRRICHRDYHLNNLFPLASGDMAVIDAQDVLVGPDTYDAVSLIEERALPQLLQRADAQRLRAAWAARTAAQAGWPDRWRLVRIQRSLKVLGTFARLTAAGRAGYGSWMSCLAARLAADAADLELPSELVDLLLD